MKIFRFGVEIIDDYTDIEDFVGTATVNQLYFSHRHKFTQVQGEGIIHIDLPFGGFYRFRQFRPLLEMCPVGIFPRREKNRIDETDKKHRNDENKAGNGQTPFSGFPHASTPWMKVRFSRKYHTVYNLLPDCRRAQPKENRSFGSSGMLPQPASRSIPKSSSQRML
jgi:hypothetical protein